MIIIKKISGRAKILRAFLLAKMTKLCWFFQFGSHFYFEITARNHKKSQNNHKTEWKRWNLNEQYINEHRKRIQNWSANCLLVRAVWMITLTANSHCVDLCLNLLTGRINGCLYESAGDILVSVGCGRHSLCFVCIIFIDDKANRGLIYSPRANKAQLD